jgi:hypothetical protein
MAQVGLNDLHFAILTKDTVEELIYETPEPIAGAIEATINPLGYFDGSSYHTSRDKACSVGLFLTINL